MTRRQIEAHVRRELKRYKQMLYLSHWNLYYGFSDEPESDFVRARVLRRKWEYREANIEFYPGNMRNDPKEEISRTVLHELLHIAVDEMREKGQKHEERVVEGLTWIIDDLDREKRELKARN